MNSEATGSPGASNPPILSVVVPVHNEADNLAALIDEIHTALEGRIEFELVYVDDCSDAATPRVLAELATPRPRLRAFRHAQRCGQSTAMATGIRQKYFFFVTQAPQGWQSTSVETKGAPQMAQNGGAIQRIFERQSGQILFCPSSR